MGDAVSIEAKIKELQHKKKKIDYVKYVMDLVSKDTKCLDFKDVQKEIVDKILPGLEEIIKVIETDEATVEKTAKTFTDAQHDALVMIADRVLNAPPKPVVAPPQAPVLTSNPPQYAPPEAPPELSHNEKLNFAINNRPLADKRVQVLNDQNTQIFGTVVGLDAPFVIVKTEIGHTLKVPLEKVNLA